jgi:hypothetical protein
MQNPAGWIVEKWLAKFLEKKDNYVRGGRRKDKG